MRKIALGDCAVNGYCISREPAGVSVRQPREILYEQFVCFRIDLHFAAGVFASILVYGLLDDTASFALARQSHIKARAIDFQFARDSYLVTDQNNLPFDIAKLDANVLEQTHVHWIIQERVEIQQYIDARFRDCTDVLEYVAGFRI